MQKSFNTLRLAGVLTWLSTGVPSIAEWISGRREISGGTPWLGFWLAFGVIYSIASATRFGSKPPRHYSALAAALSVAALGALWFRPTPFMPVLLVIVAGGLAHLTSLALATGWVAAQSAVLGAIVMHIGWPPSQALPITVAYFAFQLFALYAGHLARSEARARQELAIVNAELLATAELLTATSRTTERLRLARDLHDLLGHHLTALNVNLEVAAHLTDGKARDHVEHAQSLGKLLLSDVRAVVSDLRDDGTIDLRSILPRIVEPIPAPRIELSFDGDLRLSDPARAQAVLRAVQEIVTNSIRHSGATSLRLQIRADGGHIELQAEDNGRGVDEIRPGHGLCGLRERAEELGGTVKLSSARGRGFQVTLRIPTTDV